jgi:CRP-like cAMP-binding protein
MPGRFYFSRPHSPAIGYDAAATEDVPLIDLSETNLPAEHDIRDIDDALDLEEIRLKLWYFEPGEEIQPHAHAEQDELYYVLDGEFELTLGDPDDPEAKTVARCWQSVRYRPATPGVTPGSPSLNERLRARDRIRSGRHLRRRLSVLLGSDEGAPSSRRPRRVSFGVECEHVRLVGDICDDLHDLFDVAMWSLSSATVATNSSLIAAILSVVSRTRFPASRPSSTLFRVRIAALETSSAVAATPSIVTENDPSHRRPP